MKDYSYIGKSRDDSKTEGEFSAIFYNHKKFNVINEATFWLSENPEKRSKGWDAAYERICTYALFEDKQSKRQFYVFNTHLDHIGELARKNGVNLILQKIKSINKNNFRIIFTGDFNSEVSSDAYQSVVEVMDDSRLTSKEKSFGPHGTFNNFEFGKPVTVLIDYIFVSRNTEVLKHGVLDESKNGRYPSDHLPVYTEINLK